MFFHEPAVMFVLGVVVGVLINSAYREARIDRLRRDLESSLRLFEEKKAEPTVAPVLWGSDLKQGLEIQKTRGRVLVVEDLEPLCFSLTAILQAKGLSAEGAVNIEEARLQFERDGFDVIVVDATLGKHSGVELAKEWMDKNPELKAVLISGYPMRVEDLGIAGEVKFLAKPFSTQQLIATIDDLLAERAA